jgi:hypothetical protein
MKETDSPDGDLIDRIANALPAQVRADYYCELRHCRSFPENDELLRLIRAMQFSTLLMEQVPGLIVGGRELLDRLLEGVDRKIGESLTSTNAYQTRFDERLSKLSSMRLTADAYGHLEIGSNRAAVDRLPSISTRMLVAGGD